MRQNLPKLFVLLATIMFVIAAPRANAEDQKVRYLMYMNCTEGYTVSKFWVNYKDSDGTKKHITLDRNVREASQKSAAGKNDPYWYRGTCIDLNKLGIPDTSEVWLSFKIAGGDKESCRKDNKLFYDATIADVSDVKNAKVFYSSGTTLNNNRCQIDKFTNISSDYCYRNFKRVGTCRWSSTDAVPTSSSD